MKVKLKQYGSASPQDVARIEEEIGVSLPEDFKRFVAQYDGAAVESNTFPIEEGMDDGIRQFIPAKDIVEEMAVIENLPPFTLPFAWDGCGNFYLLDASAGKIYFWDHETADILPVADGFAELLEAMEPFSLDDVELEPGQAVRVWIDPDFLKSLKEKEKPDE